MTAPLLREPLARAMATVRREKQGSSLREAFLWEIDADAILAALAADLEVWVAMRGAFLASEEQGSVAAGAAAPFGESKP